WVRSAAWSVLGLGLLLPLATAGEPPLASVTHYRCVIETVVFGGPAVSSLHKEQTSTERIWHQGRAYRIDTTLLYLRPGGHVVDRQRVIRLNDGDGSDTEFEYLPDRKHASLSLSCVQTLFSRKYPERWQREFGGFPVNLSGHPLRTVDLTAPPKGRPAG